MQFSFFKEELSKTIYRRGSVAQNCTKMNTSKKKIVDTPSFGINTVQKNLLMCQFCLLVPARTTLLVGVNRLLCRRQTKRFDVFYTNPYCRCCRCLFVFIPATVGAIFSLCSQLRSDEHDRLKANGSLGFRAAAGQARHKNMKVVALTTRRPLNST